MQPTFKQNKAMTDSQRNLLLMTDTCLGFMDFYNGKWNLKPLVVANVNRIKAIRTDIYTQAGIQITDPKGATGTEHEKWEDAANKTEHVCYSLKSYYWEAKNKTKYAIVNFTMSDFKYGARIDAAKNMKKIQDEAALLASGTLVDFETTDQEIVDQGIAVTTFINAVPGRDIITATTEAATKALPGLFDNLRYEFDGLDLKIGSMKAGDPGFYDGYMNSRKIMDYGKGMVAEILNLAAKGYQPIFGKKLKIGNWVTVRNYSDVPVVVYLTDNPGTVEIKNEVTVAGKSALKLEIPADFGGVFGHYLMVVNQNAMDNAKVTVIYSSERSASDASELTGKLK